MEAAKLTNNLKIFRVNYVEYLEPEGLIKSHKGVSTLNLFACEMINIVNEDKEEKDDDIVKSIICKFC